MTAWIEFSDNLERIIRERLAAAGPKPDVLPVHFIPNAQWIPGERSLCETGTHGGERPPPHGWHLYTCDPGKVTCHDCLEWMHA